MRYAIVQGQDVINVILWDGEVEYEPPTGCTLVAADESVSPGWTYVNTEWIPPVEKPEEEPVEDPTVLAAKLTAVNELTTLGISEPVARTIVGLPPVS